MLRSGLRFAVGAAAGVMLWLYVTPSYSSLLAGVAGPIVRVDSRLRHAELLAPDRRVIARGGAGQPDLPGIVIPGDQLTYNVILFLGLFATNVAPLRDRGFLRLVIALLVLFATHVLALAVAIEATYANGTAGWGNRMYAPLEQDWWRAVEYVYRLAGMFGIAFGVWWMTRVNVPSADRKGRARSTA